MGYTILRTTIKHSHFQVPYSFFLNRDVLGVGAGWRVSDREGCRQKHHVKTGQNLILLHTSTFVRGAPGKVRGFVDVKHITSHDLSGVVRLGLINHVEFAFVLYQSNIPNTYTLKIRRYIPSMTYTTVEPKKCPSMGSPA